MCSVYIYLYISVVVSLDFLAHNYMISSIPTNANDLHPVEWFQVFLSNTNNHTIICIYFYLVTDVFYFFGGARGVIVVGKGHGDTSSNPGRDCLHFT